MLLPSAEDATEVQFVSGALVSVQVWALIRQAEAAKRARAAGATWIIGKVVPIASMRTFPEPVAAD
jgi:hypothetical protein